MEKLTHIIESTINPGDVRGEDGRQAAMVTLVKEEEKEQDNGMFVVLQSWDDKRLHSEFFSFVGRKVRITIETID